MNVHEQINAYIATQPEPKRSDMQALHGIILDLMPSGALLAPTRRRSSYSVNPM